MKTFKQYLLSEAIFTGLGKRLKRVITTNRSRIAKKISDVKDKPNKKNPDTYTQDRVLDYR